MRTLLAITVAAVVAFTAWSNTTVAKQTSTISVDSLSMMTASTKLTVERFDLF